MVRQCVQFLNFVPDTLVLEHGLELFRDGLAFRGETLAHDGLGNGFCGSPC
jgi:hypothetical protein